MIVFSALALARLLPMDRLVAPLSTTVESMGVWGPVLFALVYVAAAVLFVPGSALTLAAGAVFGLTLGTVVVSVASTTAAALAFLIGRYAARDAVRRWAAGNRRFDAIDSAIGRGGWKIIAMLRLSPAMPFSLGNYLFGLTAIGFWPYVLTSWLAMLPGTVMYVYLGYAGRAGLSAVAGAGGRTAGQWVMLVVGLIATVAVTVYVTRLARRAIRENTQPPQPMPAHGDTQAPPPRGQGTLGAVLAAVVALVMIGCTTYAYSNTNRVSSLFGPPRVTLAETYTDKPGGPAFDHSLLDALLAEHVDGAGLVDYGRLKSEQDRLDRYIAALAEAPLDTMGRDERLALLINAYNAFTLRLILDHAPVRSIKDIPTPQRWDAQRWSLAGGTVSLNEIEHGLIRPHFREPRIHFALVCAAIGCPPLRNEAYTADRLETQLDAQARYIHAHNRWFELNETNNTVRLTSLYNWYGNDFVQVAGSVLDYAARYAQPLREAMDAGRRPRVEFLDYDWSLNTREAR